LALLARERQKIINQLQEKQEKIVASVKKHLQNEIKRGIMAYKVKDGRFDYEFVSAIKCI